jgi:putative transposase
MERITTIGLDIAKQVFQVHGVDGAGAVVVRRKLRRDDVVGYFKALPPCLIGVEACATGHHWSRALMALGHEVRREHEAGAKAGDLARKHGVSEATLYNWKAKYGGMDVSDAKRLKALEDENAKLKKLLADQMLEASALRELLSKKW